MTYTQFENEFLAASASAADSAPATNPNSLGQIDGFALAEAVLPGVNEQWVRSAVRNFERHGWASNVIEPNSGGIWFMMTGEGRRKADSFG
jgi:hypothetical protein